MKYQEALENARNITGYEFVEFLEENFPNSIYRTSTGVFLTNNAVGDKADTYKDKHSSVFIGKNNQKAGYYRFSNGQGGDAISLLTTFLNFDMKQAVEALSGAKVTVKDIDSKNYDFSKEKRTFKKPSHCYSNKKAIDYLKSRGIKEKTIIQLINKGLIYQTRMNNHYDNVVFINKDKNWGEMRSLNDSWRGMVEGSAYCGTWELGNTKNPKNVYVCEASIDAISLFEIHSNPNFENTKSDLYVSMGGLKQSTLDNIKKKYKNANIYIATDNDTRGNEFAQKNKDLLRSIPLNKDWNEDLKFLNSVIENNKEIKLSDKEQSIQKNKLQSQNKSPIQRAKSASQNISTQKSNSVDKEK